LLGRYRPELANSYDLVQAALASSAFPCVFRPRKESEVFPGNGRIGTLFSDGGLFDNLPFIPALDLLANIQLDYQKRVSIDPIEFLRMRHAAPDLIVVGSLDALAQDDVNRNGPFDDLVTISKRGKLLQNNVKISSFQESSRRIHRQLNTLLDPSSGFTRPADLSLVNGIVNASTLAIYPSNTEHLNPTFAFCASTGFELERVRKSIADGCFQTFAGFVESSGCDEAVQQSVKVLRDRNRIPAIVSRPSDARGASKQDGLCPFFLHSTQTVASHAQKFLVQSAAPQSFKCPFFQASQAPDGDAGKATLNIYSSCIADQVHRDRHVDFCAQRKRGQQ
jgi:hypothetical protein